MSNPHQRPYHAGSVFGAGPRRPLDREQRARFRFLLSPVQQATPAAIAAAQAALAQRRAAVEARLLTRISGRI
jgi:hypothetical protein